MRDRPTTREQQCGLHLLDLARAYPHDPATPAAFALLEEYRVREAKLRRLAELREASERPSPFTKLALARHKLVKLIARRGGRVEPAKQRPLRRRDVARRPRGRIVYHAPRWPIEPEGDAGLGRLRSFSSRASGRRRKKVRLEDRTLARLAAPAGGGVRCPASSARASRGAIGQAPAALIPSA
jgi:hypothetical protein